MRWAEPAWLVLLILMPLPWLWERSRPRLAWPTLAPFAGAPRGWAARLAWLPPLLLSLAIAGMAVALARPQTVGGRTRVAAKGVAVAVAIDRSSSMKAPDFPDGDRKQTRLDAAKRTLARFISGRPDDAIGVVAFANYPDPTSLLTLDHASTLRAVAALSPAVGPEDGTNMGDAIGWALDDLRKAQATSRVLILLTDGHNDPNVPNPLDPRTAARLARELGVTLHTIAVGGEGGVIHEKDPASGLPIAAEVGGPDLALLSDLAKLGGGKAFRATDAKSLNAVFAAIDAMEKTTMTDTILTRWHERFAPWAVAALVCLAFQRLLRGGRLARLP
ncbi:MAG TPA: VWA domain-containing protein [Isosphaeraceae bacterium]|jgi:Ca-activated chloride channel family protein